MTRSGGREIKTALGDFESLAQPEDRLYGVVVTVAAAVVGAPLGAAAIALTSADVARRPGQVKERLSALFDHGISKPRPTPSSFERGFGERGLGLNPAP